MEKNEIIIYKSQDGTVKVDVLFEGKTVWLTMEQMTVLFGKSRSTINEHILNIFKEGELVEEDCMRKIGISDFSTKPTNYYNLDVIIAIMNGYVELTIPDKPNSQHQKYRLTVKGLELKKLISGNDNS